MLSMLYCEYNIGSCDFKYFIVFILFKFFKCPKISGILVVNNSIQFQFIFIALFTIQIIAKQLYRKLSFYNIFSSSLSVVTMSN